MRAPVASSLLVLASLFTLACGGGADATTPEVAEQKQLSLAQAERARGTSTSGSASQPRCTRRSPCPQHVQRSRA